MSESQKQARIALHHVDAWLDSHASYSPYAQGFRALRVHLRRAAFVNAWTLPADRARALELCAVLPLGAAGAQIVEAAEQM